MIDIKTNEELLYYNDLMELSNNQLNIEEVKQMTKLSEFAKDYEPSSKTKNISDLKEVSTDIDLIDDEFIIPAKGNVPAKTVKQKVIMQDNEKYRVPASVIGQLKIVLEDNPNCKKFKVKKSGSTIDDTRYQVIPLI
jgi:hypothetical protein